MKETAVKAALAAGKILKKEFGGKVWVKVKSKIDVVTKADMDADRIIVSIIRKKYPEHDIVSEESKHAKKSDYVWYIDPLDGTGNFSAGIPFFSTSICLAYKGELILGVVYDPLRDELFTAEKGKGAFLNNKKIKVSKESNIAKTILGADLGHVERKKTLSRLAKADDLVRGQRILGSAALGLCYTACGRLNAYMAGHVFNWDIGAGTLLVREAGGKVTDFKGKDWKLNELSVLASNKNLHSKIMQRLI